MLRNPGQLQIRVFGVIEERSDKLERERCCENLNLSPL
jgi:hypothetical protein